MSSGSGEDRGTRPRTDENGSGGTPGAESEVHTSPVELDPITARSYGTPRDPSALHQIILCCMPDGNTVAMSCNCMGKTYRGGGHVHLGYFKVGDLEEMWRLYNNPVSHNKPFKEEDKVRVRGIHYGVGVWST